MLAARCTQGCTHTACTAQAWTLNSQYLVYCIIPKRTFSQPHTPKKLHCASLHSPNAPYRQWQGSNHCYCDIDPTNHALLANCSFHSPTSTDCPCPHCQVTVDTGDMLYSIIYSISHLKAQPPLMHYNMLYKLHHPEPVCAPCQATSTIHPDTLQALHAAQRTAADNASPTHCSWQRSLINTQQSTLPIDQTSARETRVTHP